MAYTFVSASSQKIVFNAVEPISINMPFTIGAWYYVTIAGTNVRHAALSVVDSAGVYVAVGSSNLNTAGYPNTTAASTITSGITLSTWVFTICRHVNAALTQVHSWNTGTNTIADGTQVTTSATLANLSKIAIGDTDTTTPTMFMDGAVAEAWVFEGDFLQGGATCPPEMLRYMALKGPFDFGMVPLFYHSLESYDPDEFCPGFGPPIVTGAVPFPHPPYANMIRKPYFQAQPAMM